MGVLLRSSTPGQIFRELVDSLWNLGPKKSKSSSGTDSFAKNSALLATGSIGLLWFTVLPIVSPYPLNPSLQFSVKDFLDPHLHSLCWVR